MTSLAEMMASLHALERVHDEAPEITQDDIRDHFEAIQNINQKVDNIDAFMQMCKANAAMYSERAEAMNDKAVRFENMLKRCEDYVLFLIDRYPDVTYRGTNVQFRKKFNPAALQCPVIANKSFSAIINPESVLSVPESFREARVIWQLKTSEVKDRLKQGDPSITFANLRQSEKLITEIKLDNEK